MVRLRASKAGGTGSIPGWGTKIPHAVQHGEKNKINNKMFNLPENIFEKEVYESPLNKNLLLLFYAEGVSYMFTLEIFENIDKVKI